MLDCRKSRLIFRGVLLGVSLAVASAFAIAVPRPQQSPATSQPQSQPQSQWAAPPSPASDVSSAKPDAKKAKAAYARGMDAERAKNWQGAYDCYVEAVEASPANHEYLLRRELVKGQLIQAKEELAESDAVAGRLADARRALLDASYLDPSDHSITDRIAQLSDLEPRSADELKKEAQITGPVLLDYNRNKQNINLRGDTRTVYEQLARLFGVDVAFDVDLRPQPIELKIDDVDFLTALDVLGQATHTFWHPVTKRLFSVAEDTPEKRKDYETLITRTIPLSTSETAEQMQDIFRMIREVAAIHADIDAQNRTITVRGNSRSVAVAGDLIENLEQPVGEVMLEIEVLEVDRNYATQIGITPPQTTTVYSIASQQLSEASTLTGLISVLTQIFGTPSSLSGLTPVQIANEISTGQINVNSLVPPNLVAFGGGMSTFLARVPGATGRLSQTLSLVKTGRRVLLRAEDSQPAQFFVGEKFPVSLAQYSSSLTSNVNTTSISTQNFPVSTLSTGNAPTFVTAASLRNNNSQDLIVSNGTDNTISVFLNQADGTFVTPGVTYPTGLDPVWIAPFVFQTGTTASTTPNLAVVNQNANTVSVLPGKGDGTFLAKTDIPVGHVPVSVVAADFNGDGNLDLAVANQSDNTISLLFGNGTGKFTPPTTGTGLLTTGRAPTALATADLNNDGHPDLLVVNKADNTVSVFLGNGDGTFQARTDYPTGVAPVYVVTGDFNGDGVLDLAVANNTDGTVSILFGQKGSNGAANGTFASRTDYVAGAGPTSIAVADYNLDGILDLAVTDSTSNTLSLLFGLTGGTFNANYEIAVGNDPVSVVTADFNGDGRADGAIANNASNTVSVILNETSTATSSTGQQGTQFPSSEYLDLGLKMKATPHIHLDGDVTLQLHFELSGIAGQSFNSIPVINSDMLDQTVRLKQNETTVLAGIMEPSITRSLNGTPGLAEIPGLGVLGSDQTVQQQDTQLLVLITPRSVLLAPRKDHLIYAGRGVPAEIYPGIDRSERGIRPFPQQAPQQQAPPQAPPQQQRPPQQPQ